MIHNFELKGELECCFKSSLWFPRTCLFLPRALFRSVAWETPNVLDAFSDPHFFFVESVNVSLHFLLIQRMAIDFPVANIQRYFLFETLRCVILRNY
jgi:hypothetical protein